MKKTAILILLMCAMAFAGNDSIPSSVFQIRASRVIKVGDKEATARLLIASAKKMGGWLLRQEPEQITLRIPEDAVNTFLDNADSQGIVADRSFTRDDYTTEYIQLIARVQAKQSLLRNYLAILDSSGSQGIYPVAHSIADLQQSIEEAKGRIRGLQERMQFAEIVVYFRFHERRAPLASGRSDFGWINRIDLPSLLEDFRNR
jgi:hypothetical protein